MPLDTRYVPGALSSVSGGAILKRRSQCAPGRCFECSGKTLVCPGRLLSPPRLCWAYPGRCLCAPEPCLISSRRTLLVPGGCLVAQPDTKQTRGYICVPQEVLGFPGEMLWCCSEMPEFSWEVCWSLRLTLVSPGEMLGASWRCLHIQGRCLGGRGRFFGAPRYCLSSQGHIICCPRGGALGLSEGVGMPRLLVVCPGEIFGCPGRCLGDQGGAWL